MSARTVLTTLALVTTAAVAPLAIALPSSSTAGTATAVAGTTAVSHRAGATRVRALAGADDAQPAPLARPLPGLVSGRRALEVVGDRLDRVAALNDMSPAALTALLRDDPAATLDTAGRVLYRDDLSARSQPGAALPAPRFPLDQTFRLHSRPGSQRVLYIDFDGATVSGTLWNEQDGLSNGTVLGYSLDGDRSTFNTEERQLVQTVWQRVAEDYAPFDVDVTTEEPPASDITRSGSGDQRYGTRAVVTDDRRPLDAICDGQCTGVAYLDVFDETRDHDYYQPAWAFTADYNDAFNIAETVSHEVGHNFGLEHDGVTGGDAYYGGHANWTPIMGSGWGPVIQWSNGAYAGADNQQDDVALINQNGAPYITDEAGGDPGTAAAALPTGSAVIGRRTDVDVYALGTCSGSVTLTAGVAAISPDLDVLLSLVDASGRVLASANPTSGFGDGDTANGMGATLTYTASGQALFASVDGVGNGTPSTGYDDYGSLGAYTLTASGCSAGPTATPTATPTSTPTSTPTATPTSTPTVTPTGTPTSTATSTPTATTPAVTAPGAPVIGSPIRGSRGRPYTVGIRWSPPSSDGGSAITGYVVYFDRVDAYGTVLKSFYSNRLDAGRRDATFKVARGLYRFRVVAVNAEGEGDLSVASTTVKAR